VGQIAMPVAAVVLAVVDGVVSARADPAVATTLAIKTAIAQTLLIRT
jgi:hypothetical protein